MIVFHSTSKIFIFFILLVLKLFLKCHRFFIIPEKYVPVFVDCYFVGICVQWKQRKNREVSFVEH